MSLSDDLANVFCAVVVPIVTYTCLSDNIRTNLDVFAHNTYLTIQLHRKVEQKTLLEIYEEVYSGEPIYYTLQRPRRKQYSWR